MQLQQRIYFSLAFFSPSSKSYYLLRGFIASSKLWPIKCHPKIWYRVSLVKRFAMYFSVEECWNMVGWKISRHNKEDCREVKSIFSWLSQIIYLSCELFFLGGNSLWQLFTHVFIRVQRWHSVLGRQARQG